jgi:mono/diheme cytochrome c family protein
MVRKQRLVPAALVAAPLIALAIASCSKPATQESSTSTAAAPYDSVARGRYLVSVASCNDCHTPGYLFGGPDSSRLLSGSEVGWQTPLGTAYARNLTPDSTTGIGTWTAQQIVNAIRTGQRPNGDHILLPPMPWPNLSQLNDKDAYAIAAYLKSLPPISHKVPDIVPPGKKASTPVIAIPAPGKWDAPKGPPPGAPAGKA